MKVAFITSLNCGIPLFLLNEINYYTRHGLKARIFFVMNHRGIYMPPPEWEKYYLDPKKAALRQIVYFFRTPSLYIRLLHRALKTRTLFEFLIAWDFAQHMGDCKRIHAFFADHKLIIGHYCKKILGKPLPLSCSVYGYDVYIPKNKELIKQIYRETDFVVATNPLFAKILMEEFEVPKEKIMLARTVVDLVKYSNNTNHIPKDPKIAKEIEKVKGSFKILVVARLVYRKGVHILLHALKKVIEQEKNVVLWVVGEGIEKASLKKLAEKLGIEKHVIFFGALSVENLLPLYQNCDLYCQPSITDPSGDKEGFPVALSEAMAFEKVVIATKHADIPSVVPEEFLVPEEDINALARAIAHVIEMDKETRKCIGRKNREIAEREFSNKNYDMVIQKLMH
ncbi:MAG: glycosyltransferase family 4 protein [Thermoplasmata archaeon]